MSCKVVLMGSASSGLIPQPENLFLESIVDSAGRNSHTISAHTVMSDA